MRLQVLCSAIRFVSFYSPAARAGARIPMWIRLGGAALAAGEPLPGLYQIEQDLDRDAIVAFMAYNFARFFGGVGNEFRTVVADGDVVVVEHRLSATLPNGQPYINDYCFVDEVRDGKVRRIREYMDTRGGWAQVFGEGEPVQLIEFIGE